MEVKKSIQLINSQIFTLNAQRAEIQRLCNHTPIPYKFGNTNKSTCSECGITINYE